MASAEKSTKSKKSSSAPAPATPSASVSSPKSAPAPASVEKPPRRPWISTGMLFTGLFIAMMAGAGTVLPHYLPELEGRPEYQFRMEETRVTPPNHWVPREILQQVLAASSLPETVSLLKPDLCREVYKAWEKHPWVKQVKSVRIDSTPALVVDLEYRMPAAFIEVPQGFYPVDVEGVLLPPQDFSVSETSLLPHVRNIATLPQAGIGKVWDDPAVVAGAKLAAVLAPDQNIKLYWNHFKFKSIVAPTVPEGIKSEDQLTYEIETLAGNRVIWGKPPGADILEPTPQVKLARLSEFQARFGTLDGASGLNRIDIRQFDGYSLQPLEDVHYR